MSIEIAFEFIYNCTHPVITSSVGHGVVDVEVDPASVGEDVYSSENGVVTAVMSASVGMDIHRHVLIPFCCLLLCLAKKILLLTSFEDFPFKTSLAPNELSVRHWFIVTGANIFHTRLSRASFSEARGHSCGAGAEGCELPHIFKRNCILLMRMEAERQTREM